MADFISTTDVIAELQVDAVGTLQLTAITACKNAVLDLWNNMTNRTWQSTAYTDYYNYPSGEVFRDPDRHGVWLVQLKHFPVTSFTDIWDDPDRDYSDTYDKVAATDYVVASEDGVVYWETSSGPNIGVRNIKVSYTAGYTATTFAAAFTDIKQVMVRQAAHWYRQGKENLSDKSSITTPDGGSIAFSQLDQNLIPDFMAATKRFRRWNL